MQKHFNSFQNICFHSFVSFLILAATFPPAPWPFFLLCFFFRVFFPCWNDSTADYQTQIALIAGTNWKESIPGAECICLPVQKWASVPYLTSSGKGAKKPLCRRPLNSALNHTLGRFLSDEATEQADDVGKKNLAPTRPPLLPLDARDHGGNHPRRRMEIQQSNWCTPPFGWDSIWGTMKHLSRRKRRENEAFVDAVSTTLHNCSLCWVLWIGTDWGAAFSILGMLLTSIRGLLILYTDGCLNAQKGWITWKDQLLDFVFMLFYLLYSRLCAWVCIKDPHAYQQSPQFLVALRFGFLFKMWHARPWSVQTDVFHLATGLEVELWLKLIKYSNRCWYWHSSYHQSPVYVPIQML